ncbi:hypothetical protein [Shewanella algae]|uniref:hypothetical protein n=1 Tax=Shewanella algae TaxID=38313 RepID=UPI001AADE4BC|nr:hypothetical protein [Shewanella algae]MBO2628020.1 hypothetical protein [Shewanella algae]QTE96265.1 hypothetical protein JKK45_07045 [Shewanella algae]
MSQEYSSLDLPSDKQALIDILLSSNPFRASEKFDNGELPQETKSVVNNLFKFITAAQAYEKIVPLNATEEEIIKAFATNPNGLSVLDELNRARCDSWSNTLKLVLVIIEGLGNPTQAKAVSEANNFKEIAELLIPNFENLVIPEISVFRSRFLANIPSSLADKLFILFKSFLACQLAGLSDQANLFIDYLIKELITHQASQAHIMREKVLKVKGYIEASSKAGSSGRSIRYEKRDKVNAYAIKLFSERNYDSPHQAAQLIADRVLEYAESVGYSFTSAYQATRTINSWLSEHKKSQS